MEIEFVDQETGEIVTIADADGAYVTMSNKEVFTYHAFCKRFKRNPNQVTVDY